LHTFGKNLHTFQQMH